ncbi:MAG: hypothetical protein SGI73_09205 [Chloroflexota bacterium]|nr:hypothetical protein [Chloroflexota bacterium]
MRYFLLAVGMLISGGYLIRLGLILAGLLKSPVLRRFERYTAFDDAFYPLPMLLATSGLFVLCFGVLLREIAGTDYPAHMPGFVLLALALVASRSFKVAKRYPGVFLAFPRWYGDLRDRTTRTERRRIAYLWLMLPRRARSYYEWQTWAFNQWVDLVIVSTSAHTFEDIMRTVISRNRT